MVLAIGRERSGRERPDACRRRRRPGSRRAPGCRGGSGLAPRRRRRASEASNAAEAATPHGASRGSAAARERPCTPWAPGPRSPSPGRSWVSRLGFSFSSLETETPSLCAIAGEGVARLDHVVLLRFGFLLALGVLARSMSCLVGPADRARDDDHHDDRRDDQRDHGEDPRDRARAHLRGLWLHLPRAGGPSRQRARCDRDGLAVAMVAGRAAGGTPAAGWQSRSKRRSASAQSAARSSLRRGRRIGGAGDRPRRRHQDRRRVRRRAAGPRSSACPPWAPTPGTRKIECGISSRSRASAAARSRPTTAPMPESRRLAGEPVGALGHELRQPLEQRARPGAARSSTSAAPGLEVRTRHEQPGPGGLGRRRAAARARRRRAAG